MASITTSMSQAVCTFILASSLVASAMSCDITLIRQLGTVECVLHSNYDCDDQSEMWVSAGCAGLFNCNLVDNIDCDSRNTVGNNKTCACGAPIPPSPPPTPPPPTTPPNSTHIPRPGPQQVSAMSFELEMFIHFSIDTFTNDLDPTKFAPNPLLLNVSQWVAVAKSMGARVAALTSKHEKGFCLWPSNFSNFTIVHSPTVGHRDLVREFTDECRRQGIKPGLYFTTTDTYNENKTNKDEIQLQQMTELSTEYGNDIAYFWFDHHRGAPEWYAIDAIVRKHQQQCAMLGPDCWLTGQETGYSSYPQWFGVDTVDNTTEGRPVVSNGNPHGSYFKVWESDCSNYDGCHPWFYGGDNPQSLDLMMDHWESTYGLASNYILNLPPSVDGIIEPNMTAVASAFGVERFRRYGAGSSAPDVPSECELGRAEGRLAQWTPTNSNTDSKSSSSFRSRSSSSFSLNEAATELVIKLPNGTHFDRIFLSEDVVHDGQRVAEYTVDVCASMTAEGTPGCSDADDPSASNNQAQAHTNHTLSKHTVDGDGDGDGGVSQEHAAARWEGIWGRDNEYRSGLTIGTHHIDIVNTHATFVRLRLLSLLASSDGVLPIISFRVLRVAITPSS